MFKGQDFLKAKFSEVSAKTISLSGKTFARGRNEKKIKFSEAFAYERLSGPKFIRVLKIHPGGDTDVVSCDVFEVNLDSKPLFEALSYTWNLDPQWSTFEFEFVEDKEKEERPILCNGKTHHVTMNLYHALTELRRQKLVTPLWADQICINQHDSDEKIAQLGIMVDVYRSASCVTIWLGKLSLLRSNALDFMDKLTDEPFWKLQSKPDLDSLARMNSLSRAFEQISSLTKGVGDQYHWFGVILVVGRQWFQRAWTLQEFLLATDFRILMGDRTISPKSIERACSQVIDFYAQDPLSTQVGLNVSFLPLRRYLENRGTLFKEREDFKNGKRYSAEEYIRVIRVRLASVIKDKVFAGSALLKDHTFSTVDYRSTTLEIYMAFATERIWPETEIFSLSLVGGADASTEGLPSWVPDLNSPLHPEPLRYCGCPTLEKSLLTEKGDYRIEGKTLHLRAAIWDTVKEVGESIWSWTRYTEEPYNEQSKRWKMRTSTTSQTERFGLMFSLLNNLGTTYAPTGERTIDAFWQVLISGINLKTEDGLDIWRHRFEQWFAFTIVGIRSQFYLEKNHSGNYLKTSSKPKKWMVPMIADWDAMEKRISTFLDLHDTPSLPTITNDNNTLSEMEPPLRKNITHIAKRLWGTDKIEESGFWKESVADLLATVRREQFFESISFFGLHFESIYDGRRIFPNICETTPRTTSSIPNSTLLAFSTH
ncbi:Heterokaryon incompatibility protein 6 [Venturia nashicola]|nr:Heterokaryon incompatibility protein 6 [Venturia nashicola]